ncbi:unnamed protein product [Alternaria alternata]
MTRVLLTGGNGFIAAHTLDLLLKRGHSLTNYVKNGQLGFAIVPDIATPGAFDKAVISNPPFEAVLHMASPNRFNITDIKKDLIDPAVEGTVGILKSIKASASSVKCVVITSSFAAMADASKGPRPGHVYQEEDWNPVTEQEAQANAIMAYSAGKTFAEKAAWDFLAGENPAFDIAVINPPMVFGPVINGLETLENMNTSNQRILEAAQGKFQDEIPDNNLLYLWVDVRDVAAAHVAALEQPAAANKRFFTVAGYYSHREILAIIEKRFPEYNRKISAGATPGGDYPDGGTDRLYRYSNKRSVEILGIKYRDLEESIVDTVKSFQTLGL